MGNGNNKTRLKTHLDPAANWLRFLAVPFGVLMTYGATTALIKVNMALSFDMWGVFIAGLLVTLAPFIMNKFIPSALLGAGVYTVAHLLQPDFQSWMNLVFFILLTILLFQPYRKWLRAIFKLLCLGAIGVCLWCVWQEFYSGLEHFIATDKLTDAYLNNRIKTFLPGDFSFYMAMIFIVLSVRQYALSKADQLRKIDGDKGRGKSKSNKRIRRKDRKNRDGSNDDELWGY